MTIELLEAQKYKCYTCGDSLISYNTSNRIATDFRTVYKGEQPMGLVCADCQLLLDEIKYNANFTERATILLREGVISHQESMYREVIETFYTSDEDNKDEDVQIEWDEEDEEDEEYSLAEELVNFYQDIYLSTGGKVTIPPYEPHNSYAWNVQYMNKQLLVWNPNNPQVNRDYEQTFRQVIKASVNQTADLVKQKGEYKP